ncbi:cationic amino acid transporter 4-like, partial [Manduca sexta]|uniref:cationic amino acid transporter 4-like n=1 Tax=Manduca sexta TaxID=7130 RepID=UPI00188DC88D
MSEPLGSDGAGRGQRHGGRNLRAYRVRGAQRRRALSRALFLMAAVAALFAGLCYAEFATRVPRAGSAYIYKYVAIGELMAFLIGWCNILEAAVGAASLSSGLSLYLDSMVNGSMTAWYESAMPPRECPLMSPYFNLLAFLIILCVG